MSAKDPKIMLIQILIITAIHATLLFCLYAASLRVKKHSNALHVRFLSRITGLMVIASYIIQLFAKIKPEVNLSRWLLGSSALIVAIIGFASQPVISDLVNGFLISINKPFEIGDRIIVEGYEPGIVEDITLRHTVLKIYDGIRIIIPNSQLNSKALQNTSYKQTDRGVHLQFEVSYDTDVHKAMDAIRDSVAQSPYTHGIDNNGTYEDSGPVYFLKFAASSLILETTIHVIPEVSTYTATTDVNTKVLQNFRKRNIEIPYQYINIINQDAGASEETQPVKPSVKTSMQPLQRHFRTDTVRLYKTQTPLEAAAKNAEYFADRTKMERKGANRLRLLTEESVNMMKDLLINSKGTFFVEGTGKNCNIHIHMSTDIDRENYQKLLGLSTSGKNEADTGIYGKICSVIKDGLKFIQDGGQGGYNWSLTEEEKDRNKDNLSKTILLSLADNINVAVTKSSADITISITG